MDRQAVIDQLNRILQIELQGVARHHQYSFMVFGGNREPEGHTVRGMMESNLAAEKSAVRGYLDLLALARPEEVALEETARSMVREGQEHVEGLQKYLRSPDDTDRAGPPTAPRLVCSALWHG